MTPAHEVKPRGFVRGCVMSGTAVVAAVLAGCSHEAPPITVDSLIGQSVDQVQRKLPPESSMVSYDMSKPVDGSEPTYRITENGGTDAEWVIVATCAN